jgi:excisionase family DNA binding protein
MSVRGVNGEQRGQPALRMTSSRFLMAAKPPWNGTPDTPGRGRFPGSPQSRQPRKASTMPSTTTHLLTIEQLADQLATSIRHIRRLVAEKRVPYVKVGRLVRFDPDEIAGWLRNNRVAPSRTRLAGYAVTVR